MRLADADEHSPVHEQFLSERIVVRTGAGSMARCSHVPNTLALAAVNSSSFRTPF